jgi:superfamily II DNA or RNA helicase
MAGLGFGYPPTLAPPRATVAPRASSARAAPVMAPVHRIPMTEERRQEIMEMMIDDQPDHVLAAIDIYTRGGVNGAPSKILMDSSTPGCGKTHTTLAIAALLEMDIYVVAEGSQVGWWQQTAPQYGVHVVAAVTYASLALNKQYMEVRKVIVPPKKRNGNPKEETDYIATSAWMDLISGRTTGRPVLVVFDESHNLKNKCGKTLAAHAMIKPILSLSNESRVMACSGTPYDTEESALQFLRAFGLYTETSLCRHDIRDGMIYPGMNEISEAVRQLVPDADLSDGMNAMYSGKKTAALQKIVFTWFEKYLKPKFMISMSPPKIDAELDIKNAYYSIPRGQAALFGDVLMKLMRIMNFNYETGEIGQEEQGARSQLFALMPQLENYKVKYIVVPEALKILTSNTTEKVIIFVNALKSMDYIKEELADYNPIVLNGSVDKKKRSALVAEFQTNPNKRVFITNSTGATGINIDDTVGNALRTTFVIPDHSIQKMSQCVRRAYRRTTKSKSTVRIVYVNIDLEELSLISALNRKSDVYKRLLTRQVEAGVKFPIDYEVVKYGEMVKILPDAVDTDDEDEERFQPGE